jgi:hypothetical protein
MFVVFAARLEEDDRRQVALGRRRAGLGEAVGAGKLAVKLIEAAVLKLENDNVADAVEPRFGRLLSCRRR